MRTSFFPKRFAPRIAGPLIRVLAFVLVAQSTARADSPKACAEAYEKAQEESKAAHITAAIGYLTKCAARDCPSFVRKDCLQWMTEAEKALPSVVFSVRRDGSDLPTVEITVDGHLLTNTIDGKAIALDPGAHLFSFRAPDGVSRSRTLIIREGERNRLIEIDLPGLPPVKVAPPPAVTEGEEETQAREVEAPHAEPAVAGPTRSWLPYGLAGIGALGVSGFAVFGLWGHSQKTDLENSCAPFCRSGQVDEVRTKYIVADTCLAVGLVSLAAAAYYFLRDPGSASKAEASPSTAALWPSFSHGGGAVDVAIRF